jgi:hypothetical protein
MARSSDSEYVLSGSSISENIAHVTAFVPPVMLRNYQVRLKYYSVVLKFMPIVILDTWKLSRHETRATASQPLLPTFDISSSKQTKFIGDFVSTCSS